MKKPARALLLALSIIAATGPLRAQGLKPSELGARAATMGGAFAARADDASAIYFNPAGLAFQPGFRFKFDVSYNVMKTTAEVPGEAAFKSTFAPFRILPYVAVNFKDFISFGIAAFSANAMRASWPEAMTNSFSANVSSIGSTYIRPVLAFKVLKHFALGVGVDFILARQAWDYVKDFTFEETSPGRVFPARIKTNVEGRGVGFVAGWLFKPSDRFGFGGKYTSRVDIDLKGTTDFDSTSLYQTIPVHGLTTKAKMAMPEEIVVGLMFAPLQRLSIHADFQRLGMAGAVDWMFDVEARKIYDEIERYAAYRPDEDGFGAGLALRNTNRIMFGIEYLLGDSFGVRAGYSRQESSVDDDGLRRVYPDLAMEVLSLGFGYEGPMFDLANRDKKLGGLSVDASIQYGRSPGRTSEVPEFPAFYKGSRWSFGIGFGFVF